MEGWITVSDQGGKKINVQIAQITHFYDRYIWVAGSVTVEVKELGGQIAIAIEKAKGGTMNKEPIKEPKGPFDGIVKDHLAIENP